MKTIDLRQGWRVRAEFLDMDASRFMEVLARPEGKFTVDRGKGIPFPARSGWMHTDLPCDVMDLCVREGFQAEPLLETNSLSCEWVKDLSWWFVKDFDMDPAFFEEERFYLEIEWLDLNADIWVNGCPAAQHHNTFRPCQADIGRLLRPGHNQLLIRLTSGVENHYPVDSVSYYGSHIVASNQLRRVWLRKPQYVYGWDWCMPVPTCGIGRNACIQAVSGCTVEHLHVYTMALCEGEAVLQVEADVRNHSLISSDDAVLTLTIECEGKVLWHESLELYAYAGINHVQQSVKISQPALWWPNGYGDQPMHTLRAEVECRGRKAAAQPVLFGIRTLSVDQSRLEGTQRRFVIQVNGVDIYCKGGNWVPCDSLYLRITDEKYSRLIDEAARCNFNMLRVWGGGLYEPDIFYEKCSEAGILLMHDFMYSCAYYPDDDPLFYHECLLETQYQTRRLANHPCMAIWTGNNEIQWSTINWFSEATRPQEMPGERIFHTMQPTVVHNNCPEIPYLPSSPFGGPRADSFDAGDAHLWRFLLEDDDTMMDLGAYFDMTYWDKLTMKFMSENGFQGAARKSTLERYHNGHPIEKGGPIWLHHGEFEWKRPFIDGALKNMITPREALSVDEYLLYDGVLQGMLYRELSNTCYTYLDCWGNLIWMYNDCWPEMGWPIIDYYLTRKISYYYQKRAFAHRQFIVKRRCGQVELFAVNTTAQPFTVTVEYGTLDFAEGILWSKQTELTLDVQSRRCVLSFSESAAEEDGLCFIRPVTEDAGIDCATSLRCNMSAYHFAAPKASLIEQTVENGKTRIVVRAENYIPVVYLDADDTLARSDDFFEILPGQTRTVYVEGELTAPVSLGYIFPIPPAPATHT